MKKIILILIALNISILYSCASNGNSHYVETSNLTSSANNILSPNIYQTTEAPELTNSSDSSYIGGGLMFFSCGEHPESYHELDATFREYVCVKYGLNVRTEFHLVQHLYGDLFVYTEDMNPASYCHYFGISQEEYNSLYEYLKDEKHSEFVINHSLNKLMIDTDDLFDFKNNTAEAFINQEHVKNNLDEIDVNYKTINNKKYGNTIDKSIKAPLISQRIMPDIKSCKHTLSYHTIHYSLIKYIGTEKYFDYAKEFGGTENFNIIHFVVYFKIDRVLYEKIINSEGYTGEQPGYVWPYNPDYLYGDEKMQDKYFKCFDGNFDGYIETYNRDLAKFVAPNP